MSLEVRAPESGLNVQSLNIVPSNDHLFRQIQNLLEKAKLQISDFSSIRSKLGSNFGMGKEQVLINEADTLSKFIYLFVFYYVAHLIPSIRRPEL